MSIKTFQSRKVLPMETSSPFSQRELQSCKCWLSLLPTLNVGFDFGKQWLLTELLEQKKTFSEKFKTITKQRDKWYTPNPTYNPIVLVLTPGPSFDVETPCDMATLYPSTLSAINPAPLTTSTATTPIEVQQQLLGRRKQKQPQKKNGNDLIDDYLNYRNHVYRRETYLSS